MRKLGKIGLITAISGGVLLLCYALTGYYLLPYILTRQIPILINQHTGLDAKLQILSFNPFHFSAQIEHFALTEAGGAPLFSLEGLEIRPNLSDSIAQKAIVIDSVSLKHPSLHIERTPNGQIQLAVIQEQIKAKHPHPEPRTPETASPPPFLVKQIQLADAEIDWLDRLKGGERRERLQPVNLNITHLSTLPGAPAEANLNIRLSSGGEIEWRGEIDLNPLASRGSLRLNQLNLPKLAQLAPAQALPLVLVSGQLSSRANYRIEPPAPASARANSSEPGIILNGGELTLTDLKIAAPGAPEQIWLQLPGISAKNISADSHGKLLTIAAVNLDNSVLTIVKQAGGGFNFAPAPNTAPADAPSAAANPPAPAASWRIRLNELNLKNNQINFTDAGQNPPAAFSLAQLNLNVQKLASDKLPDALPLKLNALFNGDGTIQIDGFISPQPLKLSLNLDLENIKLNNFQTYLDHVLSVDIIDGGLDARGALQFAPGPAPQIAFQGDAGIANLIARDRITNQDFLKWGDMELQKISVDIPKQNYSLDKLIFDRPYLRLNVDKNRQTNLADILPQKTAAAPAKTAAPATGGSEPAIKPIVRINQIRFQNGGSDFSDFSLILPFVAKMNSLNGEIDGLATDQDKPIKLRLRGKVYDLAAVNINGSYQIGSGDSDIDLDFRDMPLPLITPYMAEFAGYKIEKGQMSLDLHYSVTQGQLAAQNKIFIDQLTLGEQIDNPRAAALPLRLAIALLKDAEGKINLDFPITGSLNDPEFSVGALIGDVLGNMIGKLAASPFNALADLLDDGDHDFSQVKFAPGSAQLNADEIAELNQIGVALQQKTGLTLDIKGIAYQAQDWPEMRDEALVAALKDLKSAELEQKGHKVRPEYLELNQEEQHRLLEKYFKQIFPDQIGYTLLGAPKIKDQPNAEFHSLARQKLQENMQPDPQRLNALAIARADAIFRYLTEKCGIDAERLYILAPETQINASDGLSSVLSLNAR